MARLESDGIVHPTGEPGLYGRSGRFEAVVAGIERMVASAAGPGYQVRRFPPVIGTDVLVRSGYPRSFPDLIGVVTTFAGNDADHAALLSRLEAGGAWETGLSPAGSALCSAACHPLYPSLTGPLAGGAGRYDVYGWVFRHEPSPDPARLQAFRQYELVALGDGETATSHAALWRERGAELLARLGLEVTTAAANDPFFGRAGRLLAAGQREAELKHEIVGPTGPDAPATALVSVNCHRDHFGEAFGIHLPGGDSAHSACVGFGVERITLALLWRHGTDVDAWPEGPRRDLGLL